MNAVLLLFILALTEAESSLESRPLEKSRKQELETEEIQIRSPECCSYEVTYLRELMQARYEDTTSRTNIVDRLHKDDFARLSASVTDLINRVNYLETLPRGK